MTCFRTGFLKVFLLYFVETFPSSYTPWFLSAWNAMAVDLYVENPEEEKTAEESVDAKNSTEGRAEDSE